MQQSLSRVEAVADAAATPLARLLHEVFRMSPGQVSASSFAFSLAAAVAIGLGHLSLGLWLMVTGQILDGVDGAIARRYGLASINGARIDTMFDRASETAVFVGFAVSGLAPARLVLLALAAILLLTSIVEKSKIDLGAKRVVLYFGHWFPYPTLFLVIFAVNLTAYVVGLLKCDIVFQHRMDALGGDLDTVASRAAELEVAERSRPGPERLLLMLASLLLALTVVTPSGDPRDRDTLHVVSQGSGPAVVLIPGLFGSAFGFRQVIPLLVAAGYRVVVIEPLGVGTSGRPADADYSLATQSERIAGVIDTLRVGPVILVAHSLGGALAFRLAVHHPELLRGIVSIEGGPTEEATTPGFRKAMRFAPLLRLFGGRMVRSKVKGMLQESSGDKSWVTDEVVHGYTDGATKDLGATIRAFKAMERAKEPQPLAPELGKIRCPVRLILGLAPHEGGIGPQEADLLRRSVTAFAVDSIPGVGHYVQEERPIALLRVVQRLAAHGGSPGPFEIDDREGDRLQH